MVNPTNAIVERIDDRDAGPGETPALLNVQNVAKMLDCSVRTVYRPIDPGRMPRSIKLGALVRWPRQTVESWIRQGCSKRNGRDT